MESLGGRKHCSQIVSHSKPELLLRLDISVSLLQISLYQYIFYLDYSNQGKPLQPYPETKLLAHSTSYQVDNTNQHNMYQIIYFFENQEGIIKLSSF